MTTYSSFSPDRCRLPQAVREAGTHVGELTGTSPARPRTATVSAIGETLGSGSSVPIPHTTSRRQNRARLSTDDPACSCLQLAVATNSPRAGYLAQFAASLVLLHMPERLIVGGGGNEDIRPDRGLAPRYRAPTWRLRPCEPARFRFRTLRHRAGARRRFRNYRCDSSGQAGGEWRMSGGRADLWIEDA